MKIKIDKNNLSNDLNIELVEISLDHIVISPDKRVYAVLNDKNDRQTALELNTFESSMLSFAHKGLHKNSHINTIYQLYLKSLEFSKTKIKEIVIESKVGDICYCSLKMNDDNLNEFFSIATLADSLVLQRMTNCKLYAIQNVWDNFDEIDEWDYEEYIVDIDDED